MLLLYIDPGAGSLLIQLLIAGALAIPFLFGAHTARVVGRIRRALRRPG